jgi:hypothetical protein
MAIEEMDVPDALAILPQVKANGEIRGASDLDGSTIKPLRDDRGMPPCILQLALLINRFSGFRRSEFHAPVDDEEADGEFSSDEPADLIRNRRA